jgi:tetratricopeptide (TPR) repeat protein
LDKRVAEPREGSRHDWLWRRARDFVAKGLVKAGNRMWAEHPHRILQAIERIEQAWALTHDPKIAIQLATMYDLANRHQDALVVLRQASHRDPRHPLLRHHAAIALLRHGAAADIRNFFTSVLRIDPDDAFAQFVVSLLDSYDGWIDDLVSSIGRQRDGRQPFILAYPVWGQAFADSFVRYICAALLSSHNLPELAKRCSVHLVIFTAAETERYLISDPLFARLKDYAAVRFVHYTDKQINYGQWMEAHYGRDEVFYSDRSLAFYYARNCKFALMSCAHYVALAAGRATDAFVSCQVADTVVNDGALPAMAARLADGVDAVLISGIQIDGAVLRPVLDQTCRRQDGVLQISSADCARILVEHLAEYNFADRSDLPRMRLRICWRVGADGILVHGNHYHPICLRPKAFAHPLQLTIDPIDSRFIDRSSLEMDRIHLVQDASIVGLSLEDSLPEQLDHGGGPLSIADVAFWLWGYWGRLRAAFFRSPLRFGPVTSGEEWTRVEAAASAVVDAIVDQAARFEESRQVGKSWRL